MSVSDDLVPILKKLRLSGVLQTLDLRTREAVDDAGRAAAVESGVISVLSQAINELETCREILLDA